MEWVFIGLGFCTVVGLSFGFLPAMRAAKLNPIDALHYE
jgi:putative ABC transport system permease protein